MGKIIWADRVRKEVLKTAKEEMNNIKTKKKK